MAASRTKAVARPVTRRDIAGRLARDMQALSNLKEVPPVYRGVRLPLAPLDVAFVRCPKCSSSLRPSDDGLGMRYCPTDFSHVYYMFSEWADALGWTVLGVVYRDRDHAPSSSLAGNVSVVRVDDGFEVWLVSGTQRTLMRVVDRQTARKVVDLFDDGRLAEVTALGLALTTHSTSSRESL